MPSYEYAENEFETMSQYMGLLWDNLQRSRRSPHQPANKSVLIDKMITKTFSVYGGAANKALYTSTITANLRANSNKTAAVAAAVAYHNT